jgi:hypothetical protein
MAWTYQSGFAPRDFAPRYPQLWKGRGGAWNAGLGPTGATLMDWSGYRNHGTLTSLTLANAWTIGKGYYTNTYNGAGYTTIGNPAAVRLSAEPFALQAWVRFVSGSFMAVAGKGFLSGTIGHGLYINLAGLPGYQVRNGSTISQADSATAINDGNWHHLLGTRVAGVTTIWVDGIAKATDSTVVTIGNDTTNFTIGVRDFGGASSFLFTGDISDVTMWNGYAPTPRQVRLLSTYPGISYEPLLPRRYRSSTGGSRRRRILIPGVA